jgi:hypothetical protein
MTTNAWPRTRNGSSARRPQAPASLAASRRHRPARESLYPYDYYRDCPDDSVGLARVASLVAEARGEATNCLLFDDGDILQGTPLGDRAAEAIIADPRAVHPVIALCRRDSREPRFQLRPRGARARLCAGALSGRLLQRAQKRWLALVSAFDLDRTHVCRRIRIRPPAQSGRDRRRAAANRAVGRSPCTRALDYDRHCRGP